MKTTIELNFSDAMAHLKQGVVTLHFIEDFKEFADFKKTLHIEHFETAALDNKKKFEAQAKAKADNNVAVNAGLFVKKAAPKAKAKAPSSSAAPTFVKVRAAQSRGKAKAKAKGKR